MGADYSGGCEVLRLQVQASQDDGGYAGLLAKALTVAEAWLAPARVYRSGHDVPDGHGTVLDGDRWYLHCGSSELSTGGQLAAGTFTFVRWQP